MTTNRLHTGAEPASETSCVSNIFRTVDNAQRLYFYKQAKKL